LRDWILTAVIFGMIPAILRDPFWGVLLWNWLAFMNPHRYAWGFARSMRFSLVVAGVTLVSFLIYKGRKLVPWRAPLILTVILFLWVCCTTVVALNPSGAYEEWERFAKIIAMVVVASALMQSRTRIDRLIAVIVLSLGFFGFKGGIFTIAHGGAYMVRGPYGSFIEGNNEIAFALVIMLPLARYLQLEIANRKIRWGIGGLMVLSGFSIVGSYSRGAFLAGSVMAVALWFRSRRKAVLALALAAAITVMYMFMPQKWHDRMGTIQTYEQDASAMGRINAWWMAWNLALDNPVLGAGARAFTLLVGIATLWTCSWLIRSGKARPELRWAYDLGTMCQTSLVGYAVGGAFLGLAYWDLPYSIVAIVAAARVIVEGELAADPESGAAAPQLRPAPEVPR